MWLPWQLRQLFCSGEILGPWPLVVWPFAGTFHPFLQVLHKNLIHTVNVLKFQKLVTCQACLDKQPRPRSDCFWRSSLIKVFSVCYSDKHFVISSLENKYFIWKQKGKSFRNFRTFTVEDILAHQIAVSVVFYPFNEQVLSHHYLYHFAGKL